MKENVNVESNNAFVHKVQNEMKSRMGDRPGAPAEMKKFNAYMSNNGENAKSCARDVTRGLDKSAFPVK